MKNALLQSRRNKGRKGDKEIAHLTPGEIVIPRAFAEDDDFRTLLAHIFEQNGASLEEYIVGSGKNKINPETGYLEFWDPWKEIKRPFKKVEKEFKRTLKKVEKEIRRFIAPDVKVPQLPEMPSPPQITTRISEQARLAGSAERRRRRMRRGGAGTVFATPGFMSPALVRKRGLKTTFG